MKCPKCNAELGKDDKFCGVCGETIREPIGGTGVTGKTSMGMNENIEGLLCYLFGWLSGVIFLLLEKQSKFVKFHAIQSIILSITLGVILYLVGELIIYLYLILWILLMYKAYKGEMYKLPMIGDFAEKQVK